MQTDTALTLVFAGVTALATVAYAWVEVVKYRETSGKDAPPHRVGRIATFGVVLVCVAVAWALLNHGSSRKDAGRSGTTSSSGTTLDRVTSTTKAQQTTTVSLGVELTAAQLAPVLVPSASYRRLFPDFYDLLNQDGNNRALQGGIPSLHLCNGPLPTVGLGAETASSYVSVPPGVRPNIYFGSNAASFSGMGAKVFLDNAAQEAPTCGWRILPGAILDDQVVRLTMDQQDPDGDVHADVILVRKEACVVEIGTATTSGTHSSDAEIIAVGAATRLAQAIQTSG